MSTGLLKEKLHGIFKTYGIYIIFILLMIVGAFLSPVFLTSKNLLNVLRQLSVIGILAFAEMLLIISGNIDLSLGAVVAFSGMVSVTAYLATGSFVITLITAMAVSAACCMASGILVAVFKLPSFIATLAMDYIARGFCYMYTGGQPTYDIKGYGNISSGFLGSIPIPVIFLLIIALICWIISSKTTLGRDIYAIGGNMDAANASGINVKKTIIKTFLIAGLLTGIAAVLQIARVNSGLPDTAQNYHGDAIASAVIGGTSFTGGIGSVPGVFVGAIIMGMISNILNLVGVQSYIQMVVKGVIIIAAIAFDLKGKNMKVSQKAAKVQKVKNSQ